MTDTYTSTPTLQAAILPMAAGWAWIRDGLALVRRRPGVFLGWSLFTSLLISFSYLVPLLGQLALILFTPLLTFVVQYVCHRVSLGQAVDWPTWTAPWREASVRRRLLRLGTAYLLACLTAGIVATLPFLDALMTALGDTDNIDAQVLLAAVRGPVTVFSLLYIVISALFWHAPALMGWHALPLNQALFFSMVACWRNKWAFLAYGAGWAAVFLGLQGFGLLLQAAGLPSALVQFALTAVNLICAAVLYCSFYPAYVGIFGPDAVPGRTHPRPDLLP